MVHVKNLKKYYFINEFKYSHLINLDKNISFIWRNKDKETPLKTLIKLRNFCKKNRRNFYIYNDIKLAKQNLDKLEGQEKKEFLKGAEMAYETILTAFASGDVKELKSLLTPDMADNFEQAIKNRNKENIKSEFTFIGIKETNLEKYQKIKNELFASVKFVSEVISVKRNKENKIIEGNPDKIKLVTDYWKFSKNILKKGPNWYLAEIVSK